MHGTTSLNLAITHPRKCARTELTIRTTNGSMADADCRAMGSGTRSGQYGLLRAFWANMEYQEYVRALMF